MYVRRMKTDTLLSFKRLEKVGDASRHDEAQPRVAKNPLQLYQHNPLIFRCLYMGPATWPKALVFGQGRYRKFSGISGCKAIYGLA